MSSSITAVRNNFLSESECDFLVSYFEKYNSGEKWENTYLLWMNKTSPLHFKKSQIRDRYLKTIAKDFPLKLNYDQIVKWPNKSFKNLHRDGTVFKENHWTSVCYLNDDFQGGETRLDNNMVPIQKGRLVVFNSRFIPHGVNEVLGTRYTYTAWWQEI